MIDLIQEMILDFHQENLFTGVRRQLNYEILEKKAFVCIGVRRCGKTTFLYQIMDALMKKAVPKHNIIYINFFDDRLTELKHGSLNTIWEAYFNLFPEKKGAEKVHFFFDELQEMPDWEPFVDRLLRTEKCDVFITGSSAKLLSKEIATHMHGRSISWELFPFSFREFLSYKKMDEIHLSSRNRLHIQKHFREYDLKGGFPEVREVSDRLRIRIHQEYYKSIILRDVIERFDAIHPQAVMQLAYRLISSISTLYSINRLTEYLKSLGYRVSKDFVSSCLQWFEDVYFIFSLKLFDLSISKQNLNAKKAYCIDHSLAASVSPRFSENKGLLLENLVFVHLRRSTERIYYYRTRKGHEVDFLYWGQRDNPRLVQVCYSISKPTTRRRELRAIQEAMNELNIHEATIVTMNEEEEIDMGPNHLHAIPAWRFLLKS
ncbi:MAG: ATP-binding protein, partial [bacterium]